MRRAVILAAVLLTGCATVKDDARLAVAADAATTLIGVSSGLVVEANPLITSPGALAASVAARLALIEYADEQYLPLINSVNWGVVGNNVAAIAGALPPLAVAVGFVSGLLAYRRAVLAQHLEGACNAVRMDHPGAVCRWKE